MHCRNFGWQKWQLLRQLGTSLRAAGHAPEQPMRVFKETAWQSGSCAGGRAACCLSSG